jgi:hypothetical protein
MKPDLLIIRALFRSKIKLLDGLKYKHKKLRNKYYLQINSFKTEFLLFNNHYILKKSRIGYGYE